MLFLIIKDTFRCHLSETSDPPHPSSLDLGGVSVMDFRSEEAGGVLQF